MRRHIPVFLLTTLACTFVAGAAERPAVRQTVETRVRTILDLQQKDGSFPLYKGRGGNVPDPIGQTALAVVAFQHALPHLQETLFDETDAAIRSGVDSIASKPVERYTLSACMALWAVVNQDPDKHKDLIKAYAEAIILGQDTRGDSRGRWGSYLKRPEELYTSERREGQVFVDHVSTFFALLGLRQARRGGLPIPKKTWERTAEFYVAAQSDKGGWGNGRTKEALHDCELNATVAGLVNLAICREMLLPGRKGCKPPPACKETDAALQWIARNWDKSADGAACETLFMIHDLGLLVGRVEAGELARDGDVTRLVEVDWPRSVDLTDGVEPVKP